MDYKGLTKYGYVPLVILIYIIALVVDLVYYSTYNYDYTSAYWSGGILAFLIFSFTIVTIVAAETDRKNSRQRERAQNEQKIPENLRLKSEVSDRDLVTENQVAEKPSPKSTSVIVNSGNEEVSVREPPLIYTPVPEDLFEEVCGRIVAWYGFFPILCRGIKVQKNHIRAAMEILNAAPGKELPQNCRNDIRENTPDGLDRRIKEYLNSDLRTANIITDLLESVGIASNIQVRNNETGRLIKGSQLNPSWCWMIRDNSPPPFNAQTIEEIKDEIRTYRNSLDHNPDDPGTWRTYEAALQRLHSLDVEEYGREKRLRDLIRNYRTESPYDRISNNSNNSTTRKRKLSISSDEVESYLETKDDLYEYE